MPQKLHIDIETYSSVNIQTSGSYNYIESVDFEILMVAFAFDTQPVRIIDLAQGDILPPEFTEGLQNPAIEKHAHNANFERNCFKKYGYDIPIDQWRCSMIKAAYCGLPLSLDGISKSLSLEDKGKFSTGKALIRYFSCPVKPTKVNGKRTRNFPDHNLEKWGEYKDYCKNDVEAEREVDNILSDYEIPEFERINYILDQEINDRGIEIDLLMALNAFNLNTTHSQKLKQRMIELTGLDNPNSLTQLKVWLSDAMGREIKSLAKQDVLTLIDEAESDTVAEVLKLRMKSSKTSIKKYIAMMNCACADERAHGLFQFYGASRTGRWAGRLIQLQNLPRNYLTSIELARETFAKGDYEFVTMMYDNISSNLSQLIRTAFVAKKDHTFAVADFSAIEARVISWLADENWRMDVFRSHGKIYEASASMMFNVPIEEITKGSDLRYKGKTAELALGYQGSVGAMIRMAGPDTDLTEDEMATIVSRWRAANPRIVKLWHDCEKYMKRAYSAVGTIIRTPYKGVSFSYDGKILRTHLPSGRALSYFEPSMGANKFGNSALRYKGVDQYTRKWTDIETYGGKIVENIVQAIARDILAYSMQRLDEDGYKIVMHVHDEAICEIPNNEPEKQLENMCNIMGEDIPWAKGLPLVADGYITPFYKKD